jgi:hypothetical protein
VRPSRARRTTFGAFIAGALVLALALAFLVGPRASSSPDGLDKVASDEGFAAQQTPHALGGAPTGGYDVAGIDDPRLSTGVAGVIGVAVTFVVASGLTLVVRRTRRTSPRRA